MVIYRVKRFIDFFYYLWYNYNVDGETLRDRRSALNLTQQELADLLGVQQNTVARWERNERAIPPYLELALKQIEAEQKKKK